MAKEIVTNSNDALLDKVHVRYFIFLIENQVDRFLFVEFLRLETEADVIKEFGFMIFIRVEEGSVLIDDVIVKVLDHYVFLYLARTLIQIFVVLGDAV